MLDIVEQEECMLLSHDHDNNVIRDLHVPGRRTENKVREPSNATYNRRKQHPTHGTFHIKMQGRVGSWRPE